MSKSFAHLIGLSFEEANCWEIVRRFYKDMFDVELKNYQTENCDDRQNTEKIIKADRGDFKQVDVADRKVGDIMVIKFRGFESHLAVYVGNDRMLHSYSTIGSHIDFVSRWEKQVIGYYRLWEE